jgi:hypothetical protein
MSGSDFVYPEFVEFDDRGLHFNELCELIEKYNIPHDVRLMSDSGWECCATDMTGVFYIKDINTIIFTQKMTINGKHYDDNQAKPYQKAYKEVIILQED